MSPALSQQRNVGGSVCQPGAGELRAGQEGQHVAPAGRLPGVEGERELPQPGALLPRPPPASHRDTGEVQYVNTSRSMFPTVNINCLQSFEHLEKPWYS